MEMHTISTELKSHFLRLYQIALSDDNFSPMEMKLLYQFAKERNIDKEQLDNILTGPIGEITIPERIEDRIEYLYDFAVMIWADGVVTVDELNTLRKYCKAFEFLDENIDQLSQYLIDAVKENMSKSSILVELKN